MERSAWCNAASDSDMCCVFLYASDPARVASELTRGDVVDALRQRASDRMQRLRQAR